MDDTRMQTFRYDEDAVKGLVTIVIPSYRSDKYIGETLESVAAQTYASWELIVVDDASFDSTEQIVAEFARRHPQHRVEFLRNAKNSGPSFSRNAAFARARGEFVALIDADDRWFPNHLAVSIKSLETSGKDLAYSSVVMIEDGTDLLLGIWGPTTEDLEKFPQRLLLYNSITPSATIMRRQVLADIGPWDEQLRYCEDLAYWLTCINAGKEFQYVGGCHVLYRRNHPGAATNKMSALHEAFAEVAARFINLRGARERIGRRLAASAYIRAAECHLNSDVRYDPSADPTRAVGLIKKAWKLKPKRVKYLYHIAKHSALDLFRSSPKPLLSNTSLEVRAAA